MSLWIRGLPLRYVDTAHAVSLLSIDVDMREQLHVVCEVYGGTYEWVLLRDGLVMGHSNAGYGQAAIALRDGLIAHFGLPREGAPVR